MPDGILNGFINQVMSMPPKEKNTFEMDMYNNPKINKDLLKQKIIHNVEMDDSELILLVKESYEDILKCIFDMNDLQYLQFVTSPRFINALSTTVLSQKQIKYETKIHINKLVYDFLTYHGNSTSEDGYMNTLMVNLGKITNQHIINLLIGIGVDDNLADFIALARYSSIEESVNIRRVNFILCTALIKNYNMDEEKDRAICLQLVIDIYCKLFTKITTLFETTMFDVYDLEESWVTDPVSEMYGITTTAVLEIVNNLTSKLIRGMLISYTSDYLQIYSPMGFKPRITLNGLSGDYERINIVISELRTENIYVP